MNALAALARGVKGMVRLKDKPLPEPEPFVTKPREPVGLLSQLTEAQRNFVRKYDGQENLGPKVLPNALAGCGE
nr:hypothetical protein [Nitrosomonas nitrosa]